MLHDNELSNKKFTYGKQHTYNLKIFKHNFKKYLESLWTSYSRNLEIYQVDSVNIFENFVVAYSFFKSLLVFWTVKPLFKL